MKMLRRDGPDSDTFEPLSASYCAQNTICTLEEFERCRFTITSNSEGPVFGFHTELFGGVGQGFWLMNFLPDLPAFLSSKSVLLVALGQPFIVYFYFLGLGKFRLEG